MARKIKIVATPKADEIDAPADVAPAPLAITSDAPAKPGTAVTTTRPATQAEKTFNMDKVMKSAEEFMSFGQGNLEAMMKASQIWATGVQEISKSVAATAQAQMDAAMSSMKALATVKSLKDAVELQSTMTRSSVETAVTEASKLTDASMKLAEQAMAPITARVTLAVEKFGRAA